MRDHREFTIQFHPSTVTELALPLLLGWLDASISEGTRFAPGETLQFGWIQARVIGRSDGDLGISEPDFASFPISWVEDVSRMLSHTWYQQEVVRSFGLQERLSYPSILQSAIVCTHLAGAPTIVMDRARSDGADSGWFIGCADPGHDHRSPTTLCRVSLYEAALQNESCILYLALPEGTLAQFGPSPPASIAVGGDIREPRPGSLVARMRGAIAGDA